MTDEERAFLWSLARMWDDNAFSEMHGAAHAELDTTAQNLLVSVGALSVSGEAPPKIPTVWPAEGMNAPGFWCRAKSDGLDMCSCGHEYAVHNRDATGTYCIYDHCKCKAYAEAVPSGSAPPPEKEPRPVGSTQLGEPYHGPPFYPHSLVDNTDEVNRAAAPPKEPHRGPHDIRCAQGKAFGHDCTCEEIRAPQEPPAPSLASKANSPNIGIDAPSPETRSVEGMLADVYTGARFECSAHRAILGEALRLYREGKEANAVWKDEAHENLDRLEAEVAALRARIAELEGRK